MKKGIMGAAIIFISDPYYFDPGLGFLNVGLKSE